MRRKLKRFRIGTISDVEGWFGLPDDGGRFLVAKGTSMKRTVMSAVLAMVVAGGVAVPDGPGLLGG